MRRKATVTGPLPLPRVLHREDGAVRLLGVEVEFIGVPLAEAGAVIADRIGGEARRETDYRVVVRGTAFGDFELELDSRFLRKAARQRKDGDAQSAVARLGHALVEPLARQLVPAEVVSPPLPMDRAEVMDAIGEALSSRGGQGTEESLLYAFGVHFNPEASSLGVRSVLAHLQAFLVLHDWLVDVLDIDLTRRVLTYINPFPVEYVRLVLSPDYRPDMTRLIDDYLEHNPTRNRALDVLPLLAHVDAARVRRHVVDERVKPRPTWHYRMPNSLVGDPGWRVMEDWYTWLVVEDLAGDEARLRAWAHEYVTRLERPFTALLESWPRRVAALLEQSE